MAPSSMPPSPQGTETVKPKLYRLPKKFLTQRVAVEGEVLSDEGNDQPSFKNTRMISPAVFVFITFLFVAVGVFLSFFVDDLHSSSTAKTLRSEVKTQPSANDGAAPVVSFSRTADERPDSRQANPAPAPAATTSTTPAPYRPSAQERPVVPPARTDSQRVLAPSPVQPRTPSQAESQRGMDSLDRIEPAAGPSPDAPSDAELLRIINQH
jgi:hypothetical protein